MSIGLTEKAILGIPIVTELGNIKPLSIYDYVQFGTELQVMSFEKSRVLHEYRMSIEDEKLKKSQEIENRLKEVMQEMSLKDIIVGLVPVFFNAYIAVVSQSIFYDVEDEESRVQKAYDFLKDLDSEQFDGLRDIILQINAQGKQKAFLDFELQRKKEQGIRLNSDNKEGPNVTTLITSVVAFTGIDYDVVKNWNYARLIHTFNRISMLKSYDTTTMFMTVSGDVEMQSWQGNFKVEDDSATSESFAQSYDSFTKNLGSKL